MSAGIASNTMPALASSICRARLCEASINGCCPRQSVMADRSLRLPLPLPVAVKLQDGSGSFLDRSSSHIELRPIEFRTQLSRERNFVGHGLTVNIVLVAWTCPHAQQSILPHLDQTLRCRMQTDHQRLF